MEVLRVTATGASLPSPLLPENLLTALKWYLLTLEGDPVSGAGAKYLHELINVPLSSTSSLLLTYHTHKSLVLRNFS